MTNRRGALAAYSYLMHRTTPGLPRDVEVYEAVLDDPESPNVIMRAGRFERPGDPASRMIEGPWLKMIERSAAAHLLEEAARVLKAELEREKYPRRG